MRTEPVTTRRRAVLITPASDERKSAKALASTADEVVLDLEDAVSPDSKEKARTAVLALLAGGANLQRTVSVRINGLDTPWGRDDLRALADLRERPTSVVVPKADPNTLGEASEMLRHAAGPIAIQALVETADAVQRIGQICSERIDTVIIGYADLGAELGRSPFAAPQQWAAVQDTVLIAARAAGIRIIDGPYLGVADDNEFRSATKWVRDSGFDGKWVIHPSQLDYVLECFTPSATSVDRARNVLQALENAATDGRGAAQLDGRMLDEAVAVAARRTLAQVGEQ